MTAYYDFFNIYIMGVVGTSFQLCLLVKILKKKLSLPFYFLFAVCAVIINEFLPIGTIMGFVAIVFLLTVCGAFVCHADVKSSLLYAALTTEIMLLCYGITQQLTGLAAPFLPAAFHDVTGIAFLLASQAEAFLLTGFCFYMVYRYFPMDALYPVDAFHPLSTAAKMQQIFLVSIPVLMIFIMSRYVSTMQFDFQYVLGTDEEKFEYLFSYWQLLAMHLLGLASLFCILFFLKNYSRISGSAQNCRCWNRKNIP